MIKKRSNIYELKSSEAYKTLVLILKLVSVDHFVTTG